MDRPGAQLLLLCLICSDQNLFLGSKKGTAGIEPATAGSAILCSTAELSTRKVVVQKSDACNFLFID